MGQRKMSRKEQRTEKKSIKDFIFEDEGCPGLLHAPSAMSVGEP